ncbi:MAG: hypothetical protein GY755_01730 [Chloroflexi bacterium]|nr:hypothetical protein [Chloroflexota bacterium]
MAETPTIYGKFTRLLHWVSVLLVFMLLVFGFVAANIASEAQQAKMYPGHILIGWITLVVMIIRIIVRFVEKAPEPPPGLSSGREKIFKANHLLLYVFIIIMLSSGVGILKLSGLSIFPGAIDPAAIQEVIPRNIHGIVSKIVMLLILMHVGGLLQYQKTKGDTLARMGVNLKKK